MPKKSPLKKNKTKQKILERFSLLILNETFNARVQAIRIHHDIPLNGFTSDIDKEYKKWIRKHAYSNYERALSKLRDKCAGYSNIYQSLFEHYLFFDAVARDFNFATARFDNIISLTIGPAEPPYFIKLHTDATKEDLAAAYKNFRKYLKKIDSTPPIYHPNKYLDRDITIVQLFRDGKYEDEIVEIINRHVFASNIKKGIKNHITVNQVKERIRKMEAQIRKLYIGD